MKTITFDDFVINEDKDCSTGWVYICEHCAKKYGINRALLDESGGGDPDTDDGPICSVEGCNHVATAYLDIPKNVSAPEDNVWNVPLSVISK